jgi:hypothetical protein
METSLLDSTIEGLKNGDIVILFKKVKVKPYRRGLRNVRIKNKVCYYAKYKDQKPYVISKKTLQMYRDIIKNG